ncbi:MAG: hypothetical protein J6W49_03230 [Paludibacteraceae bacterium]|nr:hypothetical protein [Paludibacteraceae bacterium]
MATLLEESDAERRNENADGSISAAFDELLQRQYLDGAGRQINGASVLAMRIFNKAAEGDLRAFDIIEQNMAHREADRIGGPQDYC